MDVVKTKEEIVRKYLPKYRQCAEVAYASMDEYAKQEAIGFAEFISKDYSTCELDETVIEFHDPLPDGQFQSYDTFEYFTTEELYQLYLQSKK